eukprot:scaffold25757_cov56-Attheya_sp.AAC.3
MHFLVHSGRSSLAAAFNTHEGRVMCKNSFLNAAYKGSNKSLYRQNGALWGAGRISRCRPIQYTRPATVLFLSTDERRW